MDSNALASAGQGSIDASDGRQDIDVRYESEERGDDHARDASTPVTPRSIDGVAADISATGAPPLGAAESTSVARLTVFQAVEPRRLSKHFWLDDDGELVKEPGGMMSRGTCRVRTISGPGELATSLSNLQPFHAVSWGVPSTQGDEFAVVPRDVLPTVSRNGRPVIGRTREEFCWSSGPGVLMLDYDPKEGQEPLGIERLRNLLLQVVPELANAPMVGAASASSWICNDDTGEYLRGAGGLRLYLYVADAADIPRAGGVLYERLWLAGYGRFDIGLAGQLLDRTLVDGSVWQPERLDFVGGAACDPPLVQRRPDPMVWNADAAPLDTRAVLRDLDRAERRQLAKLRTRAKKRVAARAKRVRQAWAAERAASTAGPDATPAEIETLTQMYVDAAKGARLGPDFILLPAGGAPVTVRELLADREGWHDREFADPLEPTYRNNSRIAIAKLRLPGRPVIHSFAHGGARYQLLGDPSAEDETESTGTSMDDFYAYLPSHQYLYVPTRQLWPAASVNARINPIATGRFDRDGNEVFLPATTWLDKNRGVQQMTWAPGEEMLIEGRLIADGGWFDHPGAACYNEYRPPIIPPGDPDAAGRWIGLVHRLYPADAAHIIQYLAHRVQRPGEKINHALVLGGAQGIGKDTILVPVKYAIGPWNFHEISPQQLLGRFNGFVKAVVLRVNEARDLGEVDRYGFYEHLKVYTAAPPEVLRCDEKNIKEHAVLNVCAVIITTNHKTDGIYLPADDRRHYVAWSDLTRDAIGQTDDERETYWEDLYQWYEDGGYGHVAAYLAQVDLSDFSPKSPPTKTAAFHEIVDANRPSQDAELADVMDAMGNPDAVTLGSIRESVFCRSNLRKWLDDQRARRQIPGRMESAGYVPVRNERTKNGLWMVAGKRQAIYARTALAPRERYEAASHLAQNIPSCPGPMQ